VTIASFCGPDGMREAPTDATATVQHGSSHQTHACVESLPETPVALPTPIPTPQHSKFTTFHCSPQAGLTVRTLLAHLHWHWSHTPAGSCTPSCFFLKIALLSTWIPALNQRHRSVHCRFGTCVTVPKGPFHLYPCLAAALKTLAVLLGSQSHGFVHM